MSSGLLTTTEDLIEEINQYTWYHAIDLGGGIVTPGMWSAAHWHLRTALDDVDFRGKKVLDIGCLDGLWSFEAEKRGATLVCATDLVSQVSPRRDPCFRLAHRILNSRVKYFPDMSVFNVEQLNISDFDIVFFFGVYYHLKDPLLAFARLRKVLKEGGTLIVEGQVIESPECAARFYYRKHFNGDRSNWWVPTIPCLREWVECSFFEIVKEYPLGTDCFSTIYDPEVRSGRHLMAARAVRRKDPNLGFFDPELDRFDLNRYE